MSKKSFKDINPALAFITRENEEVEDNSPSKETKLTGRTEAPEGYKVDPRFIEKRTKRVQIVLQPSLYEKVKKKADEEGTSLNNLIHNLLEREV